MRQLEQIQNQLRSFQVKIASTLQTSVEKNQPNGSYTAQQIQSALNPLEQTQLQKLMLQRKTVQTEIQQLQQKLLAPHQQQQQQQQQQTSCSSSASSNQEEPAKSNLTKLQLYQQVLLKINSIKNSKTVVSSNGETTTTQLQMTSEEFDQFKKLLELQSQLQAELNLNTSQQQSTTQQTTSQQTTTQQNPTSVSAITSTTAIGINKTIESGSLVSNNENMTHIKLNELSQAEKNKILELIKTQLLQIKNALATNKLETSQQQILKEKYIMLIKKQAEIQASIESAQSQSTSNTVTSSPKQTPIKIRNVIAANSTTKTSTLTPATTVIRAAPQTPLRALVLNKEAVIVNGSPSTSTCNIQQSVILNATPTTTNQLSTNTASSTNSVALIPLSVIANLHKQFFPNLQFKRLNFDELAVSFFLILLIDKFNDSLNRFVRLKRI